MGVNHHGTDLEAKRVHSPNGLAEDLATEARRYGRAVSDAMIGPQLLGIGGNGHLAFNEPGSSLDSRTRPVELSQATIAANSRFFDRTDAVPTTAITHGIGTIRQASRLVLGAHKGEAVRQAVEGPVTVTVPASALELHDDLLVVLDQVAASKLSTPGSP